MGVGDHEWDHPAQYAALLRPCIVKALLLYSGSPEREGRMPIAPLSVIARRVDSAPAFPILLREIGQYLWPDLVGSPHSQGRLREEPS